MVYLGLPIKNGDFPWLWWIFPWQTVGSCFMGMWKSSSIEGASKTKQRPPRLRGF